MRCYFRLLCDVISASFVMIKLRWYYPSPIYLLCIVNYSKIYFRNMRFLIAMILMDTNIPENARLEAILRKEVFGSNILEVFLESAPQFILQSYIIIKTGNASKTTCFWKYTAVSSVPFKINIYKKDWDLKFKAH